MGPKKETDELEKESDEQSASEISNIVVEPSPAPSTEVQGKYHCLFFLLFSIHIYVKILNNSQIYQEPYFGSITKKKYFKYIFVIIVFEIIVFEIFFKIDKSILYFNK